MSARKSKLRASCDACGAAKLKCDRGQPSCQRCVAKGTYCIYGICRRTGKLGAAARTVEDGTSSSMNEDDWSLDDAVPMGLNLLPTPHSSPPQPIPNDSDQQHLFSSSTLMPDPFLQQHSFAPLTASDFTSGTDRAALYPTADGLADPSQHLPLPDNVNLWAMPPDAEAFTFTGDKQHQKCTDEAYDILSDLIAIKCREDSNPGSRQTTATIQQRSLDQILHVNRKSSQRLGDLLRCSCIRSPGLAIVHALAIWRILQAYRQAADAMSQISFPLTHQHDLAMPRSSTVSLSSLPGARNSLSDEGMDHDSEMSNSNDVHSSAQITVGSFVIDDDQAKIAMSMQLLNIEVQRLKCLINLLMSSGHATQNELTFTDAADGLVENIHLWIRREYIKTASLVKARSMSFCA